jgi:hypothetical protein
MLMKFTSPGAQRVVEAVEARESKRLFHLRNKKTVADQIQKCAKGRRRRSHGHWFRDSSAIGAAQAACSFRQIDRNLCAGSTGRRNTGVKSLCWGFKLQGLTWSFV